MTNWASGACAPRSVKTAHRPPEEKATGSWWVKADRTKFTETAREKQAAMSASAEGQRIQPMLLAYDLATGRRGMGA